MAGMIPYAVNLFTTGYWQFNTAVAKSVLYRNDWTANDKLALFATNIVSTIKDTYMGFEVGRSPFPLVALPVGVLGIAVGLHRKTHRFSVAFLVTGLVLSVILAALLERLHYSRYYHPYDFFFHFFFALGLVTLVGKALQMLTLQPGGTGIVRHDSHSAFDTRHAPYYWVMGTLSVILLQQLVVFVLLCGDSARDIYFQQTAFSHWVRGNTPQGTRIAATDVGAHKYVGERYIVDLLGLTTNELRGVYYSGWGSIYQSLSRMPEDKRPEYLLTHPNAFFSGIDTSVADGLLAPIHSITLQRPAISVGPTEMLYRINWDVAQTDPGNTYSLRSGEVALDSMSVSDFAQRAAHGYSVTAGPPQFSEVDGVVRVATYQGTPKSEALADSGHRISGREEFILRSVAGEPLIIVLRTLIPQGVTQRAMVRANGQDVGVWEVLGAGDTTWQEYSFTIPAGLIQNDHTKIQIDATIDPGDQGFTTYRYWSFTP
jgi:hypothetical protein